MKEARHPQCSECGGEVTTRSVTQTFEREGLQVEVAGIQAQVCERCGEIYFASGGAQAVVEAANSLFALARTNRQHKGKLIASTRGLAKIRASKAKEVAS